MSDPVTCWIYRSNRRDELYLYLAKENAFNEIPAELMDRFGTPTLVMELDLHPGRRLEREETARVIANLREQGFHLSMLALLQD